MAPVLWFEINDWKKECDQVSVSKHYIDLYFSSESKKETFARSSLKSLRYFDNEADLDIDKLKTKFNLSIKKLADINYDPFKLFLSYKRSLTFPENSIIASRSIVSKIMNTPFEINEDRRKWIIKAKILGDRNSIHLYYDEEQENNITEQMAKQYEMLKSHLFVKHPISYYRKVTSAFHEIFAGLIRLMFGSHDLFYTTEIPGVISDHQITTKEQLKAAEPIYCDIFEDGEFSKDVINYNPIWWSKATLIKAKQCILASYDKDNDCIKDIYKFNMDKFEDKTQYENLWSPDAAWKFLNNFLQFVKDSVNKVSSSVKKKCVWKFQSFPNDEPSVSCEVLFRRMENGKETLSPLLLDLISFS